jgi:hypothetical protein
LAGAQYDGAVGREQRRPGDGRQHRLHLGAVLSKGTGSQAKGIALVEAAAKAALSAFAGK